MLKTFAIYMSFIGYDFGQLVYYYLYDVTKAIVVTLWEGGGDGGATCSSVVRAFAYCAMGPRINPSWGGPIELFLVPAIAPRLVYKGRGMCYPVCGMVHIKEPLLLIGKSNPCGGSGFSLSLSEWSLTICPTPYNRKIKCVECVVK